MRASKRASNATNAPATGSPISESQAPPVEDQSRQACLHRQLHKTKFCTYNLKGACHYGNECAFAHSCVELQVTPDLRRTQLCKAFLEATCVDPECIFAHGDEELISTGMFHKKMLCKWNEKGKCRNGDQCRFAHGTWELRIDHAKTAPKSDPMTPLKASASNKGKETGGGKQQMPMKADVDLATLAPEELQRLAESFGIQELDGLPQKLCGGYSSVNYAVVAQKGKVRVLLRVALGLQEGTVERQAGVLRALGEMGVKCPDALRSPSGIYVIPCVTSGGKEGFAMLLSWIDGVTANKLAVKDEALMLSHLGAVLAKLHSAAQPEYDLGLTAVDSDAYMQHYMHWPPGMSWEQGVGEIVGSRESWAATTTAAAATTTTSNNNKRTPKTTAKTTTTTRTTTPREQLLAFLQPRWAHARAALSAGGLPRGLLHGDPFLDNLMVGSETAGATLLDWDE
ncbi:unnamed protein product, partial [Polarella glacialis]